jgi:dihydropteroate synthase
MAEVAATTGAPVVIMHMLGNPQTMQELVNERTYDDVVSAIMWRWEERMALGEAHGLPRDKVILDPGIGFGKLPEHNLEILERMRELRCAGRPVLIGASRKGFISRIAGDTTERRLGGSVGAAVIAALNGASILRAHDVPETVGALRLVEAARQHLR